MKNQEQALSASELEKTGAASCSDTRPGGPCYLLGDRQGEVIEYVYNKYGADHVAMIGGFSTFKSRAAIADVAKTMGVSENDARRMTRYMPYNGMADMMYKRKDHQENKHLHHEERFEEIVKFALCLDGLPRHPMMHPCGIVIADRSLTDFMPLLPSNKGFMMTQMSMSLVRRIGNRRDCSIIVVRVILIVVVIIIFGIVLRR